MGYWGEPIGRPHLFYSLSDNSSDSIRSDNTGVISLTGLSPGMQVIPPGIIYHYTHTHTLTFTKHYPYWATCPPKNLRMSNTGKVDFVFLNKHQCTAQPPLLLNHYVLTECALHSTCLFTHWFIPLNQTLMSKFTTLLSEASSTFQTYNTFSSFDRHVSCAICSLLND